MYGFSCKTAESWSDAWKRRYHPEMYEFSCKNAESWSDAWNQRSHYQTKSSIDSKPAQMQSSTQTLQGPMLNKGTNSYFKPRMSTNRNDYWKMTSSTGQLVLNFRPLAGGFKCEIEIHFLHTYFWAPQQWENFWGAKKFKCRLFLNRSNAAPQIIGAAPRLTGAALQLIGTTLIFNIPLINW